MRRFVLLAVCVQTLAVSGAVHAQNAVTAQNFADDIREPTFKFGPLGLTPRIAVRNIGVDTNPLNDATMARRDFTLSVVPGTDSTLRVGRTRLLSRTDVEWNYFKESRSERTVNLSQQGRAELRLNRVMPFITGAYLRTRQRPNLEVDLRVQQLATAAGAGVGFRIGSRLRLDVEGGRTTFELGKGSHGDGALARALDRTVEAASVMTQFVLTPLTTFVVRAESRRDRFATSLFRNSQSLIVLPGFALKPSALIAGNIAVGFRQFNAVDPTVPDFTGIVGKVDAKYVMREATQFAVIAERDVEYSIDERQPYFVSSDANVTVTQILGTDWYVAGRLGRSHLVYRDFLSSGAAVAAPSGRRDRVDTYGAGIGRLLGTDVRIGIDVDHVRRKSVVPARQYSGLKVGGLIAYGF